MYRGVEKTMFSPTKQCRLSAGERRAGAHHGCFLDAGWAQSSPWCAPVCVRVFAAGGLKEIVCSDTARAHAEDSAWQTVCSVVANTQTTFK